MFDIHDALIILTGLGLISSGIACYALEIGDDNVITYNIATFIIVFILLTIYIFN